MKVVLVQFNPTIGDLQGNARKIIHHIEESKKRGADLIALPELSITGYPPRDLLDYDHFVESQLTQLNLIQQASKDTTVACGYVEKNPTNKGRAFFNALAVFKDGKQIGNYRKQLLPYYDVFDEFRYFEPGIESCVLEIAGKRIGFSICEDIWNFEGYLERLYPHQPLEAYKDQNLDLLLNLSASPFHVGKPELRKELLKTVSQYVGAPVAFCNQVGANDELVFDGCSLFIDGENLSSAESFKESYFEIELGQSPDSREWPQKEAAWIARALELGLKDYVTKCGANRVCLGLSGGIDSSVVACVAKEALGSDAVTVIALPSRFTSSASTEDAHALSKNLGVELKEISIEPFFELYEKQWQENFGKSPQALTKENLQPRIRMTLLMAISNDTNALLLNTSNKSEIATGYATLYGDSAGALSVLGDLTKEQVYALARYYNESTEVIPERVITRPPTAELRDDQKDADSLPPYDVLDALVKGSVEKALSGAQLQKAGIDEKWATLFSRLYLRSEYKRSQLPPVIRISLKAFGSGRRIPIVKG